MMDGGMVGEVNWSAEIYNPLTNASCSLPKLPGVRNYHSQDGGLLCGSSGSGPSADSCVKWSPAFGNWTTISIKVRRMGHVSWATDSGVYLMGHDESWELSTEKVKWDGSSEAGFDLKYEIRFVTMHSTSN